MKNEIAQLVKAIRELINDDLDTLMQHKENQDYIKGVLRDSPLEEKAVKLKIELMSKFVERIEYEEAQGTTSLSEYDEEMLKLSKNLLHQFRIDHGMAERF